jgi:tetraacyldisaccharide 4'-kinase
LKPSSLEIISGQRRGQTRRDRALCLFLLSKVYALAVKVRRILYNFRILRDSTLGVQVIAIGNLTVGGTGKTPVVENSPAN